MPPENVADRKAPPVAVWQWLHSPSAQALRELVHDWSAPTPAQVTQLRAQLPAHVVHAALQWASARPKLRAKFGPAGDRLIADPDSVEMASGPLVASWKASHIARCAFGARVVDVCAGMGGDSIALVHAGLRVVAIDIDPLRAWLTNHNAGCETHACDARALLHEHAGPPTLCADDILHIDPARRSSGARVWSLRDVEPGPEILAQLLKRCPNACLKLAPGVDFDELRSLVLEPANASRVHVEVISQRGTLVQSLAWTGTLADQTHARRASLLRDDAEPLTIAGNADGAGMPIAQTPHGHRWIYEVDDAIERAALMGTLARATGLSVVHPKLGLLAAPGHEAPPIPPALRSWLRGFEVLDAMAWNERKVGERLTQLRAGIVEVKTRDKLVNPDTLQRLYSRHDKFSRGKARTLPDTAHERPSEPLVLFVLRFDRTPRAIIARRIL